MVSIATTDHSWTARDSRIRPAGNGMPLSPVSISARRSGWGALEPRRIQPSPTPHERPLFQLVHHPTIQSLWPISQGVFQCPDLGTGQPQLVLCVCVRNTSCGGACLGSTLNEAGQGAPFGNHCRAYCRTRHTHLKRCSATLASGGRLHQPCRVFLMSLLCCRRETCLGDEALFSRLSA